ncbi:WbqC family protein [Labilibaculum sp. DW002]|uniref:WbqC family protein n=1 Tax=Paralabilibaculum antarcticum TaxID=2912572 RepID=A0ABT5VQU0_9BACT|nr:WbqC family protein [Labilibaculum sp. DW002]MDE5417662.1 WbqC family protein [Labilibaculum sp. DW002]
MKNTKTLLATSFFAPIQYYCKLVQYPEIFIEQWENYSKQTYRNRCNIYGANGVLPLSIPVVKATSKKILTKDVRISYDTNWQKLHWKGIEAAYKSSPFYEYYIDDFERFFTKKWDNLLEFNKEIQDEILGLLEIEPNIQFTDDFIEFGNSEYDDYRNIIHPKTSKSGIDRTFNQEKYTQVFGDKHGFQENLSILDLIFNLGPDSLSYLESSIVDL